ncbi:MAG: DUF2098 domain-containing protein [archaeon]|nr:DUF2098 domain-containing protein [archaeon]
MVVDVRGETIEIGSFIRYSGTGTISKVADFKDEDEKTWVKIEEPALWYSADSLEVVSEKDLIEIENTLDAEDAVQKLKDAQLDLSDSLNDIQGCEGGG